MKLPKKVKVGPHSYAVEVVPNLCDPENPQQALYGHWKSSPPTIRIRAGETPARTLAILLHEGIHVIDEYMLIGLSEKQTTRLATGLAAFLQDNRLLREDG